MASGTLLHTAKHLRLSEVKFVKMDGYKVVFFSVGGYRESHLEIVDLETYEHLLSLTFGAFASGFFSGKDMCDGIWLGDSFPVCFDFSSRWHRGDRLSYVIQPQHGDPYLQSCAPQELYWKLSLPLYNAASCECVWESIDPKLETQIYRFVADQGTNYGINLEDFPSLRRKQYYSPSDAVDPSYLTGIYVKRMVTDSSYYFEDLTLEEWKSIFSQ